MHIYSYMSHTLCLFYLYLHLQILITINEKKTEIIKFMKF